MAALDLYQRAEVLVSLSKPDSINQALLRLIHGDDSERNRDIEIVSDAIKRMSFLTMRRHRFDDDLVVSAEDVAQSSWVKVLEAIEKQNFSEKHLEHPSGYLYQIVRKTVTEETKKYEGLSNKRIQFVDIEDYELVEAPPPNPDEVLELRVRLLEYIRRYLFETAGKPRQLRRRLEDLKSAVVRSAAEDVLSEALIKYFVGLATSEGRESAAPELRKWNEVAVQVLGNSAEFELALRVLATIIRYVNTNDKKTFLELRLEERAFIEPLLDDFTA